jgi:2-oxoisovalerate ferredoxin oxidoreductase alpha subunit
MFQKRDFEMTKMVITGNSAVAYGAKLARAEVVAAYPITPQTTIVEKLAEFVGNGEMDTQYIMVESEHSAMAACIAASTTGVRAFTATSAQGLALMHELLMWASGARLPLVMANVNRAMGPPWSVWADHQDSIAQRDTGWIQLYSENNQEVLDTILQLYKACEDPEILLPGLTTLDAFYLSHTYEVVDMPDQELVDEYLPQFNPEYKLDVDDPHGFGSLVMPHTWHMEFRYKIAEAMDKARIKLLEAEKEFEKMFGRSYGGLLDNYRTEDADVVLMAAGTNASTAREAVDDLRAEGKKVGLARIRFFRPFPYEEVRKMVKGKDVIGVSERTFTFGYGGPFFAEVGGAIYNDNQGDDRPILKNYMLGVGGRDVQKKHVIDIFNNMISIKEHGTLDEEIYWYGLKDAEKPGSEGGF